MGFGSEVEDDEGYLDEQKGEDEEKKEDDLNEGSELEKEKDFEDDQIKSGEFGDDDQELPEEKEESIWDDIDWSEDKHGEGEKTIWDDIDWSEDIHGEREKNEKDKNDDQNEEYNKENYVENVESQSISTVLTNEIEEIEGNVEHQEQEEKIEIRPEEYQDDTEPIVNNDEVEFIKDVEELAEHARELKAEDEDIEPQAEKENAAYYAEQYYETLKEKEVAKDQDSKEGQETEELRQEVAEELKADQESGYKSDELEEEGINEVSNEITSTEEFEYLWEVREKLDREGKSSEEIEEVMHEAEEMYETLKNAEKLYEEQELEKLKLVDHEDEASEEDLKEDLDRVDLVEQAVELEEKLVQQGKSQEEIDVRVEESIEEVIETTKFEEKLEKIIEKERKELLNHEDEESVEKEDLDRVDQIEQTVELEEKLVQQGKSQEEIDVRVEESIEEVIETTKFEEKLEKIIEKERKELLNREDDEDIDVTREYIDRPAEAEYYLEVEDELRRQGMSQEEIDEQMEEIANSYQNEINKKPENEQESIVNEKLKKHDLEINEQNSSAEYCDQIELTSAFSNEKEVETYENVENKENLEVLKPELDAMESESDEEEDERFQELYRQETGRRPIYARKKTKGYNQWLEQRELRAEKIKSSKRESEKKTEIEEEDWKTTLKQWMKEASEEECNAELKSELKKALESYNEFGDLTRKFLELYEKSQSEKLSEKEKNRLKSLTERLQKLDLIQLELLANIRAFKDFFYNHFWELMNRFFVNRVRGKFFKHISQKYKELKKEHDSIFTTLDFIESLYLEVNRLVYILAQKNPDKFKMSLNKISILWGYTSNWLGRVLREKRDILSNPKKRKDKLEELEIILEEKIGWKALNTLILIKKFKNNKITSTNFIKQLQIELGKIIDLDINTNEIIKLKVPKNLFFYILWGNKRYIHDVIMSIEGKATNLRPNFKFSKESLQIIFDNLKKIFGDRMKNFKQIIEKYIEKNPDLKEYPKQQYTIKNVHYFSSIKNPDLISDVEVYYWYGFLNADGSLYMDRANHVIFFGLKERDKERVFRFAEVVGYDKKRINIRTILREYKDKIIESKRAEVRFGARIMYNDIMSQGYTSSKDEKKTIPHFIFKLIDNAEIEAKRSKMHWWCVPSGKKALAWLLGFYDGDGSLKEGRYGRLYSGSEQFLNLIAETFDCIHRAKSKGKPTGFSIRESYYLVLGTELFNAMLSSFKNSMKRKRPKFH